ncbi:hypothetical protein SAMN05216327_104166 [Dyadobacter sp. SG02]|nr:hypothetical protein SAMN05216327_104166 [Dyadobacter sp. SG02]
MTNKSRKSERRPPSTNGNRIVNFLFFVSLLLMIWGISMYRQTIIDAKYLLGACIFGIVAANLLLPLFVATTYSRTLAVLTRSIIGAGFFYFALLFLNQQFRSKIILAEEFEIVERGSLARGKSARCSQPYVMVDFHGEMKQLIFYCDKEDTIKRSRKMILNYSKGAFGFAVVESSRFVG